MPARAAKMKRRRMNAGCFVLLIAIFVPIAALTVIF